MTCLITLLDTLFLYAEITLGFSIIMLSSSAQQLFFSLESYLYMSHPFNFIRSWNMHRSVELKYMQKFGDMDCQVQYWIYFMLFLCSHFLDISWTYMWYTTVRLEQLYFSGDAHHITQPHADGKGAILAMIRALEQVRSLCFFPLFFSFIWLLYVLKINVASSYLETFYHMSVLFEYLFFA